MAPGMVNAVFDTMNSDSVKCPVCGGIMNRVKALPTKLARLVRYKCTCGHCEDLKDNEPLRHDKAQELVVLDGFQELP